MRIANISRLALGWLLAVAAARPGVAQETPPEGAEAAAASAEALAAQGTEAFQAGDYTRAIGLFTEAFDQDPHPVIMFNLARAYQEQGALPDALLRFRSVLSMDAPAPVRDAATARIQDVAALLVGQGYDPEVVTPDTYVPRGTLTVVSQPEGASVYINGELRGRTPYVQERIDQGYYSLRVDLDGYHPINGDIEVRGGRNNMRTFSLSPRATLEEYVPPTPGFLTIRAPMSGLDIELDGQPYGYTPMLAQPIPPGRYAVSVSGEGWHPFQTEVEVASSRETEVVCRMEPIDEREMVDPNRGRRLTGVALMAAGGASAAAGVAFGVVALGRASDYRDDVRSPDRADIRRSARSSALLSDIGIGTGAALFVTGAILHWVGGKPDTNVDRDLLVTPSVAPGRASLTLHVTY